ncbi:MAG: DUF1003 domain-containing protein [Candidatus Woesearchaeota archaeon]
MVRKSAKPSIRNRIENINIQKRGTNHKTIKNNHNYVNKSIIHKHSNHPTLGQKLTLGQKAADFIAKWAGSWVFIIFMILFMIVWIILNILMVSYRWDIYPFILLNLILSVLAGMQAPVILMSQNRAAERDRINASYDYQVNRKAEREIQQMQQEVKLLKRMIYEIHHVHKDRIKKARHNDSNLNIILKNL